SIARAPRAPEAVRRRDSHVGGDGHAAGEGVGDLDRGRDAQPRRARTRLKVRDASVLANAIEAHHPDPYQAVSRTALRREAARVDALGAHDRNLLIVELMRMLARLGPRNGHSAIFPIEDHPTARRAYPLWLSEFEDSVFVVGSPRHELVGA